MPSQNDLIASLFKLSKQRVFARLPPKLIWNRTKTPKAKEIVVQARNKSVLEEDYVSVTSPNHVSSRTSAWKLDFQHYEEPQGLLFEIQKAYSDSTIATGSTNYTEPVKDSYNNECHNYKYKNYLIIRK